MTTNRFLVGLGICTALVFGGLQADAAMDILLQIPGIPGESQIVGHTNDIDVLAWSWSLSNPKSATNLGTIVSIQDLSITKYLDTASPRLMLKVCQGDKIPEVVLIMQHAGTTPLVFYKITMTNVRITSASTGGSGGEDRLTETISMNFETVKVEYAPQNSDGSLGTWISFGWNIIQNKLIL